MKKSEYDLMEVPCAPNYTDWLEEANKGSVMKLYLINFKESNHEASDEFIVVSKNEKDAIELIKNKEVGWEEGYTIKEIRAEDYTETKIILSNFNHPIFSG